jgi:uncharacterized protein (TIGR00297 family)
MQLILGLFFGILVAVIAWRAGSLSRSGAIAAALSGGLIFGLGGLPWASLLLAFFISSSLLSKSFSRRKAAFNEKFSKGSQRDWAQVLANGGLGAVLAVFLYFFPDQPWIWFAYTGAMAAVNADTWATELGVFNPTPPRLITTGAQVERGASGGVSLLGSFAAFTGGAFIGLWAMLWNIHPSGGKILVAAMLGGLAGSFFDSLLGATIQTIYTCPLCQKETERHPLHTCGTPTTRLRGWPWLNNDLVNLSASIMGAIVATLVWLL